MIIESESLIKKHQVAKKALKDHRDANSDVFKTDKRLKKEYEWFKEMLLRYEFSKHQDKPTSDNFSSMTKHASLPIVICVQNTSSKPTKATIFGAAMNYHLPNHGNPSNIKVTSGVASVTYQQILSNTLSTCFSCSYIRLIDIQKPIQIQEYWTVTSINMEGQMVSTPIHNSASFSPFQQQPGVLDLIYPLKIDALTDVSFNMLGKSTMTIYIYPATVISPIHTLINNNPSRNYSSPNLPTVFSEIPSDAVKKYTDEISGSMYYVSEEYGTNDSVNAEKAKPSKTEELMGSILTTLQEIEKRQKEGSYPVLNKSWSDSTPLSFQPAAPSVYVPPVEEPRQEVVTPTATGAPEANPGMVEEAIRPSRPSESTPYVKTPANKKPKPGKKPSKTSKRK